MENTVVVAFNKTKLKSIRIGNASINYSGYSDKWGVSFCLTVKDNEPIPFEYKGFDTLQEAIQYAESQC
jgi:hypothetical protein